MQPSPEASWLLILIDTVCKHQSRTINKSLGFTKLSGNFINPVMLCMKCVLSNSSTTKIRGLLEIPADLDLHWFQKAILYKNSFIGLKELNSSFIISVILSVKCVKLKTKGLRDVPSDLDLTVRKCQRCTTNKFIT